MGIVKSMAGCVSAVQGTKFDDEIVHAAPSTTPWGTHAYIIEAETAERLLLLGNHIIDRARRPRIKEGVLLAAGRA